MLNKTNYFIKKSYQTYFKSKSEPVYKDCQEWKVKKKFLLVIAIVKFQNQSILYKIKVINLVTKLWEQS